MASHARRSPAPLLYVNYTGSNAIEIYEQAGKHQKPIGSIVSSTLTNIIAMNTDLRVDRAGDIVVANWPEIDYFHQNSNGVPFKRLKNRGMSFSFVSDDSSLWTTDIANINVIENVRTSDDRVLDKIYTPKRYVGSLAAWPPD